NARMWQPSQEDVESIRFAVANGGNTSDMADAIVEKAENAAQPLIDRPPPIHVPLAAMYEQMLRTAFDNRPMSDLPEQQKHLQEIVFKRFTTGLIDQAESCTDP